MRGLLCSFNISKSFTEHFHIFWHKKMLQAYLVLYLPQLCKHQSFSLRTSVPLVQNGS